MNKRLVSLTAPEMREHVVRAEVRGQVDLDVYVTALEALQAVLEACTAAESYYDDGTGDAADVAEQVTAAIEGAKKAETDAAETLETAEAERKKAEAEANARCAAMDVECKALRARAEKAEHALASAVKDGHGLDQEHHAELAEARRALQEARGELSSAQVDPPWLPELLAALGHSGGHWNGAIAEVRALREKHTEVSKVARAWLEGAIGWMEAADQLAKLLFGAEEYERRTTERITGLGKRPMKRRAKT